MTNQEENRFLRPSVSQRYERYEARMRGIRRRYDNVADHPVASCLIVAFIVGLVLTFLAIIGSFFGVLVSEDFVYGDKVPFAAKAFLSDTTFQFASAEGESLWGAEVPYLPGEYRVRGMSENGFGRPRYTDSATFRILPRPLTVTISDAQCFYGDFDLTFVSENTRIQGLANGDRVVDLDYTVTESAMGGIEVSVKGIKILNASDEDVTACYAIETHDGSFTVLPRPITVSGVRAEKVYDGNPWHDAEAEVTTGTLAYEDRLTVTFPAAPAEVGQYELQPTCAVWNVEGEDVTSRYDITVLPTVLTVTRRPITIRTEDAEKVYDGTPLRQSAWQLIDGTLVEGQSMTVTVTGSLLRAGQEPNDATVVIQDALEQDMTPNYQITVEAGTLKIIPIVLKFKTESAEKIYDGVALTAKGCELVEGELVKGHTLSFAAVGTQTNAGSSQNTLLVGVRNKTGIIVTEEGYRIEVDYGILTVKPRPITLTSDSAEKLYDGTPLTCESFRLTEGSYVKRPGVETVRWTYFTGSQTEVGSSYNTFTVKIENSYGDDTTENYAITYRYGVLTVHENPNDGHGGSGGGHGGGHGGGGDGQGGDEEGPNNGVSVGGTGTSIGFSAPDSKVYAQVTGTKGFSDSQRVYFRGASYGDYTGKGWDAPPLDPAASEFSYVSPMTYIGRRYFEAGRRESIVHIDLMNGCPVLVPYYTWNINPIMADRPGINDCYITGGRRSYDLGLYPSFPYSDLRAAKVHSYDVEREKAYREFVHQTYLQIPDDMKEFLLSWGSQHGISADRKTLVTDIQTVITHAAVYNLNGKPYPEDVDVVVYFLTEAKEGICQHFASAATMLYRAFGIPARYTTGFVGQVVNGQTTNLTGNMAHAWVEIYLDGLGWVAMEVTGSSLAPEQKIPLRVMAYSATKYYDGETFEGYEVEKYSMLGVLREGDRLVVTVQDRCIAPAPGNYENRITSCVVYDQDGNDVTNRYYTPELFDGTLTILPRKITVTVGSARKKQDGKPLTCREYWISEGTLVMDDELELEIDAILTEPGTMINEGTNAVIWRPMPRGKKADVSSFYEIHVVHGQLEMIE